jgi:hypothetical protein
LVDACTPPVPHGNGSRLSADEVDAWYARHGAKPPKDLVDAGCDLLRIGPDGEEALACGRVRQPAEGKASSPDHVYRLAFDWVVIVVRARRVQTLGSIPYIVDVLDKVMAGNGPLFAMGVVLDAGGTRIAVMEPGENACAQARTHLADQLKQAAAAEDADARRSMTAWARFDAKLLEGLCKQPRLWIWKEGRFRPFGPAVTGVVSSEKSPKSSSTSISNGR